MGWMDRSLSFHIIVFSLPLIMSILSTIFIQRIKGSASIIPVFIFLLIDIFTLTYFFMVLGGSTNPLTSLYLIPILISVLLLEWPLTVFIFIACILSYLLNMQMFIPLNLSPISYHSLHNWGMFISFLSCAGFSVFFVKLLHHNLQQKESEFQKIKNSQEMDTHLTKMGLIAANSAHELNTPLSNLAMITESFEKNPVLKVETISKLKKQIDRCEQSIQKMLKAFGQSSAHHSQPISKVLHSLTVQLNDLFPNNKFQFNSSLSLQAPSLLEDILLSLLSNSAIHSTTVSATFKKSDSMLYIRIEDEGPGLSESQSLLLSESLDKQLQYYLQDTVSQRGIGLILVQYMLRQLEGTLQFPSPGICDVSIPISKGQSND